MTKASLVSFLGVFLGFIASNGQKPTVLYTPTQWGVHMDGNRIGQWRYFDTPGKLGLMIDYSKNELNYFAPDTSMFIVDSNGRWVQSRMQRPCRIHGSTLDFTSHYYEAVPVPLELVSKARRTGTPFSALLTFEIDTNGIAKNPKFHGDDEYSIKKTMLDGFQTAPNVWITGIKSNGERTKCLMGITFQICLDGDCASIEEPQSKVLVQIGKPKQKRHDPFEKLYRESHGISYSPDDRFILIEQGIIGGDFARPSFSNAFLVPADSGSVSPLPFSNLQGVNWIGNDRIAFKYKYRIAPVTYGVYNRKSGAVETRPDSLPYFLTTNSTHSLFAFATPAGVTTRLWTYQTVTKLTKEIKVEKRGVVYPASLSPDGTKVLLYEYYAEEKRLLLHNYKLETGVIQLAPIINASVCGWSSDGSKYYLMTLKAIGSDNFTIIEVDAHANSSRVIFERVPGVRTIFYSAKHDAFFFTNQDGNLYYQPAKEALDPLKIHDDVHRFTLNHAYTHIAFISRKDKKLFSFEIESRRIRQLTGTKK